MGISSRRSLPATIILLAFATFALAAYAADDALAANSPQAMTVDANDIRGAAATFYGYVNPEGAATSYWFEYGKTTAYGTKTASGAAGSGTKLVGIPPVVVENLSPNTTYHLRLVAENSVGVTHGEDRSFTTTDWQWLSGGKILDEGTVYPMELTGTLTFKDIPIKPENYYSCDVTMEMSVTEPGIGEVTGMDTDVETCHGSGSYNQCQVVSSSGSFPWPLQIDGSGSTPTIEVSEASFQWNLKESPCYNLFNAFKFSGSITLDPGQAGDITVVDIVGDEANENISWDRLVGSATQTGEYTIGIG